MDYGYYDYGYDAGTAVATGLGAAFGFLIFIYIIVLAVSVFSIVCMWKVFKKAGKNGWESLIPIYNIVVLIQITELPMWYIALFLVPVGNVVALFLIYIELAKKFGQSTGFGIGLVFLNPIFMAMLAFGKNYVYQSASAPVANSQVTYPQQPMNSVPVEPQQPMNSVPVEPQQPMNSAPVGPQQPMNSVPVEPQQPMNSVPVEPQQPMNSVPVEPQQPQRTNCSNCGSPVNPGDRFCMNCGRQL